MTAENKSIDQLDDAGTIQGDEEMVVVQQGDTVKTTVQDVANLPMVNADDNIAVGIGVQGSAYIQGFAGATGVGVFDFSVTGQPQIRNQDTGKTWTWPSATGATGTVLTDTAGNGTLAFNVVDPNTIVFPDSDPHKAGAGYWVLGVLTKSTG